MMLVIFSLMVECSGQSPNYAQFPYNQEGLLRKFRRRGVIVVVVVVVEVVFPLFLVRGMPPKRASGGSG